MVYLFESELPENKSVFLSLMHIYGLGKFTSLSICKQLGFSRNFKVKNLSKEQINKLVKTIEHLNIELASDLKKSKILKSFFCKEEKFSCSMGSLIVCFFIRKKNFIS